ncbi:MAG TPA: hypothetical protein VLS45_09840, partial [Methylomicrobium sp.]|nr:hypothetical protein [Methylomicrobium sp.]
MIFYVFDDSTLSLLNRLIFLFWPLLPLIPLGLSSFASSSTEYLCQILMDEHGEAHRICDPFARR